VIDTSGTFEDTDRQIEHVCGILSGASAVS